MNRFFKVIWNAQKQMLVVVSELAKSHTKTPKSRNSVGQISINSFIRKLSSLYIAIAIFSSNVTAADIQVYQFSPQDPFEEIISGSNNLIGSFAGVKKGSAGFSSTTMGQAKANGLITGESAQWIDKDILRMGSQTKSINYKDPITGNVTSMKVYDNNDIKTDPAKDFRISISSPVGKNGQYLDRNLYHVGQDAILNVNVGQTTGNWVGSADNRFNAILKSSSSANNNSSVFLVNQGGELNYKSKTVVELGNQNNNIKDSSNPVAWMVAADFVGTFDSVIGTQNITNVDEFKAYNNALIKALQEGKIKLTEAEYSAELNKARDTASHPIYVNTNDIPADDAVRGIVNRDVVSYIHGDGSGANITIDSDANIQMVASDAVLVNLENGAKLTNNGTLGTAGNTLRGAYVVAVRKNSFFDNNGVIDAGTNPEMEDFFQQGAAGVANGNQVALLAIGSSVVNNNSTGVINVASRGSYASNYAVTLNSDTIFNNFGAINIAASAEKNNILESGTNYGVIVQHRSVFNNEGALYIGHMAQRTPSDSTEDLAIKQPSIGVRVNTNAKYFGSENSEIVIGSKVQNAVGIDISGASTLDQQGKITLNGAVSGKSVSSNTGIMVLAGTDASKVVNSGVIDINGLNSFGIRVVAALE